MTTEITYIKNAMVLRDSAKTQRWYDVFGANVVKWSEEGVVFPIDPTNRYTETAVSIGVGTSAVAGSNAAGGALVATSAANEDDGVQLQSPLEVFSFAAAYPFYMGICWQGGDVDQTDFLFGACITDTTLLGGMTDGIYFQSVDGTGAVTLEIEKDSAATSIAIGTMTDATNMTLELYWSGTALSAWVDGVQVTAALATTNLPNDELLTFSFAMLTGEGNANTITIDWMRMFQIQA
ncbi:MAG: hypothetical protein GY841_10385 [FCB group bacterium]|nr:hypothetical protein [FCB group bacterium]